MNNLADFHVHPDYSIDAEGDIASFCRQAINVGLDAICFTTHYDSNPRRVEQDGYWNRNGKRERISDSLVAEYVAAVQTARDTFGDRGLDVYCGLEVDYYPDVEREVERLRSIFPLDFVMGSLHCLSDVAISDRKEAPAYFGKITVDQMADEYFSLLLMAASCPDFDCLGHLDYYVRFGWQYYARDMNRIRIERFDPVFNRLLATGIGIEVNTSPFRRGEEEFHPSREILNRAIDSGVHIVSVGSDSHKPADLGKGVTEAYSFLRGRKVDPKLPVRT